MNRDQKNIDKFFHRDLAGASEQPPLHIWQNIESVLDDGEQKRVIRLHQNRKRFAVTAVCLLIAVSGFFAWNTLNRDPEEITADNTEEIKRIPGAKTDKINSIQPSASVHTIKIAAQPVVVQSNSASAANSNTIRYVHVKQTGDGHEPVAEAMPVQSIAEPVTTTSFVESNTMRAVAATQTTLSFHKPSVRPAPLVLPYAKSTLASQNSAAMVRVKRPSRFAVTAFFAPDITTRNLEQNFFTSLDEKKEELLRTEKNSRLDFTIGARVEYKLNKHWSIQSGLSFSVNTIDIAPKMMFGRFDKDGALKFRFSLSSGYAFIKPKSLPGPRFFGDSAQASGSTSTLHYVNVPLAVKYNYALGRFNLSAQAGVAVRFITKQGLDAVYASNGIKEKTQADQIQGLKTSYFNGVVGVGVDYALSKKIALTIFPSFNFATTSINRDSPVKAYPNTLSLASGLKFSL